MRFFCAEGQPFFDDCGCGCDLDAVGSEPACGADLTKDDASYDPAQCATMAEIPCAEGVPFSDECGCGCQLDAPVEPACGDDPAKDYVSFDPETCRGKLSLCAEGLPFFDECGCGCLLGASEPCGANACAAGELVATRAAAPRAPPGGFCTEQFCRPIE